MMSSVNSIQSHDAQCNRDRRRMANMMLSCYAERYIGLNGADTCAEESTKVTFSKKLRLRGFFLLFCTVVIVSK